MENKYYTPELEDFKIGYKCEIKNDFPIAWKSITFEDYFLFPHLQNWLEKKDIRTEYLTKANIESLDYIFNNDSNPDISCSFNKEKINLSYNFITKILRIDNSNLLILYYGSCKSINELKTILKLLNI